MKNPLGSLVRRLPFLARATATSRHALVGRADLWQMKRAFQIRFLKDVGLVPGHRLFELGCGTLRGGIPIIEYLEEGHYVGVDVRANVIEEARKELAEAGLEWKNPTLLAADPTLLSLDSAFDFVWAFSVLIHMTDELLHGSLDFVSGILDEAGSFYANVNALEREDGRWAGFPVVGRTLEFYGAAAAAHGMTLTDLGTLRSLGHVSGVASQDDQRMLRMTKV